MLHHQHKGEPPGGHFHRTTARRIEIKKEGIVEQDTEFGTEINIDVAFGKGSKDHCGSGSGDGGNRLRMQGHGKPPGSCGLLARAMIPNSSSSTYPTESV